MIELFKVWIKIWCILCFRDSLSWYHKIWSRYLMRMSLKWVFSPFKVLKSVTFIPDRWKKCIYLTFFFFFSLPAAHVWSGRCGCERLEREHQVQEQLLRQPRSYPVVLESKSTFHAWSQLAELWHIIFSFLRRALYWLFICLLCVVIGRASDGCRKENPALAVCDRHIQGPNERLCWALWWDKTSL